MHVCITGPKTCPPEIGGVEVFCWEIAKRVASRGVHVTVVSGRAKRQSRLETIQHVDIARMWSIRSRPFLKLSNMPGINRMLSRAAPDVVHANDATSGFVATNGARRGRSVVTVHGVGYATSDWPPPFRQGIRFFQQRAIRRAAVVVTTDEVTAAAIRPVRHPVEIIPPGVDTDIFRRGFYPWPDRMPQGKFNLLYVGRLTSVKGFDLLVEALDRLPPAVKSDVVLTVIGDGPMSRLAQGVKSINWLGEMPHQALPPYLAHADLLVLPSRSEGLPITMLEAMSAELPVVCSLVGGISARFGNQEVNIIESLTPLGIADAVARAASDMSASRKKASMAADIVRKEFSWDSIAQSYIQIYERLAA